MPVCPVCSGGEFSTLVNDRGVRGECQLRERFIRDRLAHPVSSDQLKDLTNFFHAGRAEVAICSECKLLIRRELECQPAKTYSEEPYDPGAIEAVYPQYLSAFNAKEKYYRSLLPAKASIIEIGSHYGAFLQTAQEWG